MITVNTSSITTNILNNATDSFRTSKTDILETTTMAQLVYNTADRNFTVEKTGLQGSSGPADHVVSMPSTRSIPALGLADTDLAVKTLAEIVYHDTDSDFFEDRYADLANWAFDVLTKEKEGGSDVLPSGIRASRDKKPRTWLIELFALSNRWKITRLFSQVDSTASTLFTRPQQFERLLDIYIRRLFLSPIAGKQQANNIWSQLVAELAAIRTCFKSASADFRPDVRAMAMDCIKERIAAIESVDRICIVLTHISPDRLWASMEEAYQAGASLLHDRMAILIHLYFAIAVFDLPHFQGRCDDALKKYNTKTKDCTISGFINARARIGTYHYWSLTERAAARHRIVSTSVPE